MSKIESLDIILAGGKGERLFPLTRDRVKPAVPFFKARIISNVSSNCYNSGDGDIIVLMQGKYKSLVKHIRDAWTHLQKEEFISSIHPDHGEEYKGTADAVFQNLPLVEEGARIIHILAGDHVYLMDNGQMRQFHADHNADMTVAAIPIKTEDASGLGVLVANERGEVVDFKEKVPSPPEIPNMPGYVWGSMGIYVFSRSPLVRILKENSRKEFREEFRQYKEMVIQNPDLYTLNDFGYDIIPAMIRAGKRVMLYDFRQNKVPGAPESMTGYWRDIGNLDQYFDANMDLTGDNPRLVLEIPEWPLITHDESGGKPVRLSPESAVGCAVADGVTIDGVAENCVIGYNVDIRDRAEVTRAVFLGNNYVGKGVRIKDAIVDRGVRIPDGKITIGVFHEEDREMGFTLSPGGRVVVPRNYQFK